MYDEEEFQCDPSMFLSDAQLKDQQNHKSELPTKVAISKEVMTAFAHSTSEEFEAYQWIEELVNNSTFDEEDFSDDDDSLGYYVYDQDLPDFETVEIGDLTLDRDIVQGITEIITTETNPEVRRAKFINLAQMIIERDRQAYVKMTGACQSSIPARVKHGIIQREENGYSTALVGLVGGVKKKKTRRRVKKKQGAPLIRSTQLGQINSMVPYDKPITTTLRFNGSFITDGSGILSSRFSLRNPLRAFNGSGSYVNAVDFASLYDQYRVRELAFQFEPVGNTKGPIVVACDYDSPDTSTPNYANIVNYGGYRIYTSERQFNYATRVPNITSAFDSSNDPPTALVVHQGGWIDAATSAAPGNIFIGGQNLGNSVTIGNFVVTMRIQWRFRR